MNGTPCPGRCVGTSRVCQHIEIKATSAISPSCRAPEGLASKPTRSYQCLFFTENDSKGADEREPECSFQGCPPDSLARTTSHPNTSNTFFTPQRLRFISEITASFERLRAAQSFPGEGTRGSRARRKRRRPWSKSGNRSPGKTN